MKTLRILALAATIVAMACSSDDNKVTQPTPPEGQVPDFAAVDVNSTSARSGQPVSPRDYMKKVSAWYFGHAT